MYSEEPVLEFAAFDPAIPGGTSSLDALLNLFRERGIDVWVQGGQVKLRPAELVDDLALAAVERYKGPLMWMCARRLNPAWWRPMSEAWFSDRLDAIEWFYLKWKARNDEGENVGRTEGPVCRLEFK